MTILLDLDAIRASMILLLSCGLQIFDIFSFLVARESFYMEGGEPTGYEAWSMIRTARIWRNHPLGAPTRIKDTLLDGMSCSYR